MQFFSKSKDRRQIDIKKKYVIPDLSVNEFGLCDIILFSIIIPTEEWEPPILTKRRMREELEGDGLGLEEDETEY